MQNMSMWVVGRVGAYMRVRLKAHYLEVRLVYIAKGTKLITVRDP